MENLLRYQWKPYLLYGQKRDLKKNQLLYRQGELGAGFYYLAEGKVTIKILSDQGIERIVDYIPEGFLIGEQGFLEKPYMTTAITETKSILYYFSNETFQEMYKEHESVRILYMNSLIQKIRLLAETVSLLNSPVELQIAHFLHKLHHKYGSSQIPINQTSLAQYIGTSRISIYKILKQWLKKDLIYIGNRSIYLLDIDRIESIFKNDSTLSFEANCNYSTKEATWVHAVPQQKENLNSWESYLRYGERKFVKRKSILYKQGDIGKGFYFINKGLIKILTPTSERRERILDIRGSGFLIGEQAIDQMPYFSSAIAIEDSVVYYFTIDQYKNLMNTYPDFLLLFANSAIQKVKILLDGIILGTVTSEQQVAFSLLQLMDSCQTNEINLTQQELADYAGLTRITVYKIIKKWKYDQLIDINKRRFIIRRPDVLKKYAAV
ncbi:Crp/Fnr family transcriptional regulator [Bacillaceae bacterium C204]|uniref:Crp/Fnr family transcriptional regulator n=1 Tax=Neobacillus sp. 204 TaxID=3383351 RepID=UPI00397C0EE9